MWKGGESERENGFSSLAATITRPSSHHHHPPFIFFSAAAPSTYLQIACLSGRTTKTVPRSRDGESDVLAALLFLPFFFMIFIIPAAPLHSSAWVGDWCSSFAQCLPSANPPHTKSRKWLQVHFLKGTVAQSRGDGQRMVMLGMIRGPRQECRHCPLEHLCAHLILYMQYINI